MSTLCADIPEKTQLFPFLTDALYYIFMTSCHNSVSAHLRTHTHNTGTIVSDLQRCVCFCLRIGGKGGAVVQLEWSRKAARLYGSMPGIPEVSPGEHLSCGLIFPGSRDTNTQTHTNMNWCGWRRAPAACGKAAGGLACWSVKCGQCWRGRVTSSHS